jgi:hypothetical protein
LMKNSGFGGITILKSEHAVSIRNVKKLRFRRDVWRGVTELRSYIVDAEIRTPVTYMYGDKIITHPSLYAALVARTL